MVNKLDMNFTLVVQLHQNCYKIYKNRTSYFQIDFTKIETSPRQEKVDCNVQMTTSLMAINVRCEFRGLMAINVGCEFRGLMAINVRCEFRGRGSIPSVCQITDADLGQVG